MTGLAFTLLFALATGPAHAASRAPPTAQELGYREGCVALYGATGGVHLIDVKCPGPDIEPPVVGVMRPLAKAELQSLLSGVYVRTKTPPGLQDLSTLRQFSRDGSSYLEYADNLEIEGHYTVEAGKVCVKDEFHPRYCQYVAVDGAGQYYMGKSLSPMHLRPVSIQPIPKQGG